MGATGDHNRVLRDAAREAFEPLGLTQKGRSRSWNDDRVWHLIHVEFQPSSWSKGSYLNVGAMWLFRPKDYYSFDHGYRVKEWQEVEDDWPAKAGELAAHAAARVQELRSEIRDLPAAVHILDREQRTSTGWPRYNAAIANGLLGKVDRAAELFDALPRDDDRDWWQQALASADELRALLADPPAFRARVIGDIAESRKLLKLPPRSAAEIEAALEHREAAGVRDVVRDLFGRR